MNTRPAAPSIFAVFLFLLFGAGCFNTVASAEEQRSSQWNSSLSLGLNLTRGNSETSLVTATLESHRKEAKNDLRLRAEWNHGTAETEKSDGTKDTEVNVQNIQGTAMLRHLLSERAYAYLNLNALQDDIATIDYRVILGTGGGYYLLRSEKTELSLEGGPSYIAEKVNGNRDGSFALRAAERFDYRFTEISGVWETLEYLARLQDTRDYLVNAELGAEASLSTTLGLRVVLQNKYDNTPASGKEENDLVLTAGIRYAF